MSEFDLRNNYFQNLGYPIKSDYSLIQLDLYRLLCYFTASKVIVDISRKYENNLFNDSLRLEYEKSEISRIIINLAIIARNELDNNNQAKSILYSDKLNIVGSISKNNDTDNIDLTLREACNKIIHCEYINWDLENPKSISDYDGLNPFIYLYGNYMDQEWKATLNIFDFINNYLKLIQL